MYKSASVDIMNRAGTFYFYQTCFIMSVFCPSRCVTQMLYIQWCWSDTRHSHISGPPGRCRWGPRWAGSWAVSRRPAGSRCRCKPSGRTRWREGPGPASGNTNTQKNNHVSFGGWLWLFHSLYRRLSGQLSGLVWCLIKHLEKLHKLHLMTEVKLQTNLQNRQWNKSTLLDVSFEINSFVLLICLWLSDLWQICKASINCLQVFHECNLMFCCSNHNFSVVTSAECTDGKFATPETAPWPKAHRLDPEPVTVCPYSRTSSLSAVPWPPCGVEQTKTMSPPPRGDPQSITKQSSASCTHTSRCTAIIKPRESWAS